ncbi:unnamed protein product [Cylindrotheca closterium]|uniref:Helicase-associated domain-containing protein n=1 Tax=Cylindrotheca closterium TaxID=2856 RepID=A0AAD2FY00_9STRA|nr:unnamed protein product [Cylindrotheca closterium]
MNHHRTASHPIEVCRALLLGHHQGQQQFETTAPELIQTTSCGPTHLADLRLGMLTPLPLDFSSANLFGQSLAPTLGDAFEPTPFRANHKHDSSSKQSWDSETSIVGQQESTCSPDYLCSKGKHILSSPLATPSTVSVQSSSESCQFEDHYSNDEHHQQDSESESTDQFSRYQQSHWEGQYRALVQFRRETGHCRVPHKYKANLGLARWVKRQRYQYRLRQEGDLTSTMTDYRLQKLEKVGFIWFSHASTWEQRLMELKAFRDENGHCNVSSSYPANPKLAVWVKCQRRQHKLFKLSKSSHMTPERIEALEEIGFKWELRQGVKPNLQR